MENSRGPNIDPWGTPEVTGWMVGEWLFER